MSKNEIDSTVLLFGVIAGAAALLLIPSGQSWLCGVAGLAVLLSLFAYDVEGVRTVFQSLAFSAVSGLSFAVAAAPIAPYLFSLTGPTDPLLGQKWLPILWLGSTILLLVIDRARMSSRVPADQSGLSARPTLRAASGPTQPFVPPPAPAAP